MNFPAFAFGYFYLGVFIHWKVESTAASGLGFFFNTGLNRLVASLTVTQSALIRINMSVGTTLQNVAAGGTVNSRCAVAVIGIGSVRECIALGLTADAALMVAVAIYAIVTDTQFNAAYVAKLVAVKVLMLCKRQDCSGSEYHTAQRADRSARVSLLEAGRGDVILFYKVMLQLRLIFLVGVITSLADVRDHTIALAAHLSERFGLIIVTGCLFEHKSAMDAGVADLEGYCNRS